MPILVEMIPVACAIIRSADGKTLVVQRSATMLLPLKWEFPGGKVEAGETAEECLVREIREELDIRITITGTLQPHAHHYERVSILLIPFLAEIDSGELVLHEHAASAWLERDELTGLDWAEADVAVMKEYVTGDIYFV